MEKKQNLKDFLETLKRDRIVAIGAAGGDSFLYIGEAGNMELIEKCYTNYLAKTKKRLSANMIKLKNLILNPPVMGEDEEENKKAIKYCANIIGRLDRAIDRNIKYINTYQPVMDRMVKEFYQREVDNALVILIDGLESGEFWFKSEFDKKYKK